MRHANKLVAILCATVSIATHASTTCAPVYLTFDTGHMGIAPLIADILKRHKVRVTFFAAHERTQVGDGSLGTHWASWWKERAAEGHEFASHTYNHVYWRGEKHWNTTLAATYCDELKHASQRLQEMTGKAPLLLLSLIRMELHNQVDIARVTHGIDLIRNKIFVETIIAPVLKILCNAVTFLIKLVYIETGARLQIRTS